MDFNRIGGAGPSRPPEEYAWNQEDEDYLRQFLDEARTNEAGPSSAAPEETYDVSWAVPERFSHGSQPAPQRMIERLSHHGLLPDADQPTMSYEIRGHRYTATLDPTSGTRLIHNPPEDQRMGEGPQGVPDFGAFFRETCRRNVPLPEQWAPLALIEKLREAGYMPTPNHPTTIALDGKLHKAELIEGGFVRLTRQG
ncbi:hypothetical protein [Bradyrhizobium septentrionale]|uniref:Type III effector NopAB n=1 Tax=Bradyrhizobium septentrionale TaxID=1404411 RepID=A0ABZ2NY23_9BRAD